MWFKKQSLHERVVQVVEEILEIYTPVFTRHGGGAELVFVGETYVVLKIKGNCESCALAPLTFGLGIEKQIKERLPHITEVRYATS